MAGAAAGAERTGRANDVTNSEPGEKVAAFDVGFEGWIRVS